MPGLAHARQRPSDAPSVSFLPAGVVSCPLILDDHREAQNEDSSTSDSISLSGSGL
jgi:hypothetical protein